MDNNVLIKYEPFFAKYKLQYYKRGETLLRPDDNVTYIYYVRSGYTQSYLISEEGTQVSHTLYSAGDIFPLNIILGDTQNDYYYEAVTPVEVYKVPREDFENFLQTNKQLLYELTIHITKISIKLLQRIEQFAIGKAYHKVALRLAFLAQNFGQSEGTNIVIPIPLTHEDIANSLGLTRETTSIQLKKLERDGYIKYKGNFLVVKTNKFSKKFDSKFS